MSDTARIGDPLWWRGAVTYQLYIRSFADGDGDGLGDVAGIRSRLPHLVELGVDALWVNPWYPSPQADGGYDVADYLDIHPPFGDLDQAQAMIEEAQALGLKVLLDIVPNHTSSEHAWFRAALAAAPGSPERARYVFRPGRGPGGDQPPNDWTSVFGGPAWTRVVGSDGPGQADGEWYLHLFDPAQPDLNWDDARVRADFLDILRFWFDRGVDGFRIDVAHGLVKDSELPDLLLEPGSQRLLGSVTMPDHPHWDRPEVHEIYREWRALGDSYDPPRVYVAEAWVDDPDRRAAYLRADELHCAFDFDFMAAPWEAVAMREAVQSSLQAHEAVGAPVMWTLSNHDVARHVSRLGRPTADRSADPLHGWNGVTDVDLGRRRARAILLLVLALPGGVYLYQGEELGLEEVEDLPEHLLQDPTWERSGHRERGRDGCRVPLPWQQDGPSLGFGTGPAWLPQPAGWAALSVQAQERDPGSMLSLYRDALRVRRELPALGAGGLGDLRWLDLGDGVLGFAREPGFTCVVNVSDRPVPLPPGRVVLSSGSPTGGGAGTGGTLEVDAAAWLVRG